MLRYLSQLKKLDVAQLDRIAAELQGTPIEWSEPYPEYASPGLKVATLYNPDGVQNNFDYHDCRKPVATPLAESLTELKAFIEALGFNLMGSRLLRLEPGTFLHEHRDYVYLEDVPRFRLHVPLITNDRAFITSPGINIHFKHGYLWKLDPKETVHSACNFGSQPRIHLMMDCYGNDEITGLIDNEWLDENAKYPLPAFSDAIEKSLIEEAQSVLASGRQQAAEEILLRIFCQYDLGRVTTYDLIARLYAAGPDHETRLAYWMERLHEVYPERRPTMASVG